MQSLRLVNQEDNVVASQCALCKGHSVGLHPTLLTVSQLANPCISASQTKAATYLGLALCQIHLIKKHLAGSWILDRYPICCVHNHLHASIFTFICSHDLLFIHVLNCIYIFIYIHPYSSLSNYDHSHIHLHPCIQLVYPHDLSSSFDDFHPHSSIFNHTHPHPPCASTIHLHQITSIYIHPHPPLYPPLIHMQFAVHLVYKHVLNIAFSWMYIFKQPF